MCSERRTICLHGRHKRVFIARTRLNSTVLNFRRVLRIFHAHSHGTQSHGRRSVREINFLTRVCFLNQTLMRPEKTMRHVCPLQMNVL